MTSKFVASRRNRLVAYLENIRRTKIAERKEQPQYTVDGRRLLTSEEKLRALDRLIENIKKNAERTGITIHVKED